MNFTTAQTVVGGIGGVAAGVAGIVVGAIQGQPGFIVIGVAFLAAVIFALILGATASPRGALPPKWKIGAKFFALPEWALLVVGLILVVGGVSGGVLLAV